MDHGRTDRSHPRLRPGAGQGGKRRSRCAVTIRSAVPAAMITASLLALWPSGPRAQEADLQRCLSIAEINARVACYDALARAQGPAAPSPPPAAVPPAPAAPSLASKPPPPALPPAPAPAQRPGLR